MGSLTIKPRMLKYWQKEVQLLSYLKPFLHPNEFVYAQPSPETSTLEMNYNVSISRRKFFFFSRRILATNSLDFIRESTNKLPDEIGLYAYGDRGLELAKKLVEIFPEKGFVAHLRGEVQG